MAGYSDIEWTDATWNPVSGCRIISAGCTNCYAMRMAARLQAMKHPSYEETTRKSGDRHVWTGKVNLIDHVLEAPLSWRKPRLVFVNSMSDLFQDAVPFEYVERVWSVMEQASAHTFQVLTKQPERMAKFLGSRESKPLPNVWVGTSVEDAEVSWRIDALKEVPSKVRFVSFEPLIGSVGNISMSKIHWAIVGGESGPRSRPMLTDWVDEIFDACEAENASFFFKQWGGVNKKKAGRVFRDKVWDDMPRMAAA